MTQTIQQLIERVESLPRMRDTTVRLIGMVSDPSTPIGDIVDVLRYDPILTTDLLRIANSAASGVVRRIESVEEAVKLVGTGRVLQLVLAANTQSVLEAPQEGYGLFEGALWQHSIATALAGQTLAAYLKRRDTGAIYTAGLLHDIGKVVLNECVADDYATILRLVSEEGHSFLEAESSVLGFTHAEAGARLAECWGLPPSIIKCIRFHHTPDECEEDVLVDLTHIADTIALSTGIGGGYDGLAYRAHPEIIKRYGLKEPDLERIGLETITEVKDVRSLFASEAGV